MLDPAREAELERHLRQFCGDAFCGRNGSEDGSSISDATLVVHSVLAGAAERWNAALQVNRMPARAFLSFLEALSFSELVQVARVCRHWRKAAPSDPRLWSRLRLCAKHFYLDPKDNDFVLWANPGFLSQVLRWSACHPLNLGVHGIFGIYVDAFCDAYTGLSDRLRSLHVDFVVSYTDFERLSNLLSVPYPFLEHLTITSSTGSPGPDGIPLKHPFSAPRLRSLSLLGCSLSDSIGLLPSVVKLVVERDSTTASKAWTQRIFTTFPNLDELSIPNYGESDNFPAASYQLRSLPIGSAPSGDKLRHLPPYRFSEISRVKLFWPSHKVAKDLLAKFATISPRTLSITSVYQGRGFLLSLSDADQDFRCECVMEEKDLNRVLPTVSLPAVTTVTISDQCFPDPTWNLVASLPALAHLTILISGSPFRRMLTHVDSPAAESSPPHPSLQTVTIRADEEYYARESSSSRGALNPPSVFAADVERVVTSRLPTRKSSDGRSNMPKVCGRGVVSKDRHNRGHGVRGEWSLLYDRTPATYVALGQDCT